MKSSKPGTIAPKERLDQAGTDWGDRVENRTRRLGFQLGEVFAQGSRDLIEVDWLAVEGDNATSVRYGCSRIIECFQCLFVELAEDH